MLPSTAFPTPGQQILILLRAGSGKDPLGPGSLIQSCLDLAGGPRQRETSWSSGQCPGGLFPLRNAPVPSAGFVCLFFAILLHWCGTDRNSHEVSLSLISIHCSTSSEICELFVPWKQAGDTQLSFQGRCQVDFRVWMQEEMLARATEALEVFWHNIQDIYIDLCNTAAKNSLQLPPSSEIPDNSFFFPLNALRCVHLDILCQVFLPSGRLQIDFWKV